MGVPLAKRFAATLIVCFLLACATLVTAAGAAGEASENALAQGDGRTVVIEFQQPVEGYLILNTSIRRSFPFRFPRAPSYIEVPLQLVFEVHGKELAVKVPEGVERFSLVGPFSKGAVLVPYAAFFKERDFSNTTRVTLVWPVEYGFRVLFENLPLLNGTYPRFSVEVTGLDPRLPGSYGLRRLTPDEQLRISSMVPELYFLSSSIILPPGVQCKVTVKVSIDGGGVSFEKTLRTSANVTITVSEVAEEIMRVNRDRLSSLFANITALLDELETAGYYLGGSKLLLSLAENVTKEGEGGPLEEACRQRLAYALLSNLYARLTKLAAGPGFIYAISVAVVNLLLSMLVSWMAFERGIGRWALSLLLFAALSALSPALLPKLRIEIAALVAAAAVFGVLAVARAVIRARPVQGARTASGASLEGLLSSTVSFAVSFLSRRKVRAVLLLVTVLAISLGVTCLTSFSMYSAVSQQVSGEVTSGLRSPYLIVRGQSPAGPLNTAGLGFLSGRSEVLAIAPSAVAFYPMNPPGSIGGVPISGIIGVSHGSPLIERLQAVMSEGSAQDLRAGTILVSDAAAKAAGIRVGDTVTIRDYEFVVAGIFDSKMLSELKDLDGEDLIPIVTMGESSFKAPSEGVVFMYYGDALLLGAITNKVYVELAAGADSEGLARSLSLLGNVNVYVAEPGKQLRVYYPGFKVVVVGAELAIPAAISLLIVLSAFAGFTYEVRRDIFTLSTLGATPDQVFLVFMTLAAVVGFAGGAIGYLLGMATFRMLNLVEVHIPVDVKLDLLSLLFAIALSVTLALAGALAPASKAVVAVVPSLRRRWAPEAEEVGRREAEREVTLVTPIPVIIRSPEKAREFADFIEAKLSELAAQKVSVYNVNRWEEEGTIVVYFEYIQVEGRAFKSYNKVRILKTDSTYGVELESRIVTIYTMFAKDCLRDVASLVRKLTLEWRAEES